MDYNPRPKVTQFSQSDIDVENAEINRLKARKDDVKSQASKALRRLDMEMRARKERVKRMEARASG
jgi:hypothetical protein